MKNPISRARCAFKLVGLLGLLGAGARAEAPIDLKPDAVIQPTPKTPENEGPTSPDHVAPGERPTQKSYLIPALEIPAFIFLLNRLDLLIYGPEEYGVSLQSIRDHILHGEWTVDQDVFTINQIGHPYQGAMYYGFARSANLNYWESLLYSSAGSVIWEITGETTDPSINDQVATGIGGSFIGEALYRLSNLVLEDGQPKPGKLRYVASGLISPPTLFNRLVFGERFGPVFESRHPAIFSRLQLGAGSNATRDAPGSNTQLARTAGYGNFQIAYGLPGKPGYRYNRPLDYFDFELEGIIEKKDAYMSGMIRGLLFGAPYEGGENYRGVWGLYGSFDYLSPQVYRVSTTAASLGTTGQWWLSKKVALQGTALAGLGYGAAGTILPSTSEADYHYGATPQQLLNLRLLFGKRVMIDATGRNYFITRIGATKAPGSETIQHVNASFTLRLFGHQAVSVGYLLAHRDANYANGTLPDRNQRVQTVTFTYTLLGHPHFRTVEWREGAE